MGLDGSGPEFHVNFGSGRVGLDHFSCGSGWVRSRKLDPRPTLSQRR